MMMRCVAVAGLLLIGAALWGWLRNCKVSGAPALAELVASVNGSELAAFFAIQIRALDVVQSDAIAASVAAAARLRQVPGLFAQQRGARPDAAQNQTQLPDFGGELRSCIDRIIYVVR